MKKKTNNILAVILIVLGIVMYKISDNTGFSCCNR